MSDSAPEKQNNRLKYKRTPPGTSGKDRRIRGGHRAAALFQWLIIAFIPARLGSMAFTGASSLGWTITIPGTVLLGLGLTRLFTRREEQLLLVQYQHLLGYLNTRLAAGLPLEAALTASVAPVSEQIGRHNAISRALVRLRKNLQAQMALRPALAGFIRDVNLPCCRRDFTIMSMLSELGGRIDVFVRQSHHDLSAQINAETEVAHERRGNASEAVILSVIPFVMARFIGSAAGSYGSALPQEQTAVPMAVLYLTAMAALFILLTALAPKKVTEARRLRKKSAPGKQRPETMSAAARFLSWVYLELLPGQIGRSLSAAIRVLSDHGDAVWSRYMNQKVKDIAFGFLLGAAAVSTGRVHVLTAALFPLLISAMRDIAACSDSVRRREQYRFYYPSVISTLYILLESGLTLDRALRMVSRVHLRHAQGGNPVASDLAGISIRLESGYDGAMAVQSLSDRCPLPEIQASLHLMARYEREGGREILELIRMQSDRGRQLYRDAIRGRAEQRSLLLTLPMALDLIVVMGTVVLPAVLSMRSIL